MSKHPASTKEERILYAVKKVLTRVIRETATPPGLKHPLSEACIQDMRDCLVLIASREQELARAAGRSSDERPRFSDESRSRDTVVIPISQIQRKDE